MALSPTKVALCNKVSSDYDSLVSPLKSAKGTFNKHSRDLDTLLRGMTYTPASALEEGIDEFKNDVGDSLPENDTAGLNDISTFFEQCEYLSDQNKTSAIKGTIDSTYDNITSLINSFGLIFPEFNAGFIMDAINTLLNGAGIPGGDSLSSLFRKADSLLNCLSAACASVDPSYNNRVSYITDDLQSLYDDMNIIDDPLDPNYGKFNYEKVFDDVGATLDQRENLNKVIGGITEQNEKAKEAIDGCLVSIKQEAKTNGSFINVV